MTNSSDRRPDTPMSSAAAARCRLTYGNRARGFHQGQSIQMLANRPVIVTQSGLSKPALQFRGSPYSSGEVLTFALSGAPPRTLAKRALLIGASVLERVVSRHSRRCAVHSGSAVDNHQ